MSYLEEKLPILIAQTIYLEVTLVGDVVIL